MQIGIWFRGVEPRGIWLRTTNHHPTINVSDVVVRVVGESPEGNTFNLLFDPIPLLKAGESRELPCWWKVEELLDEFFPAYDQSGVVISEKATGGGRFDHFPLKVHFRYEPMQQGADKVEGTQELILEVLRREH